MAQQTATFTNVPPDEIEALTKDHKEMGAQKIEVVKQPDGFYSLKLTYPDTSSSDES